jgi:hypothetical protein
VAEGELTDRRQLRFGKPYWLSASGGSALFFLLHCPWSCCYDPKYRVVTASQFSLSEYDARKPLFPGPNDDPYLPPPQAVPGPPSRPPANPRVRVDLLITVDAAIGNISDSLDRSVGRCVRTNFELLSNGAEEYREVSGWIKQSHSSK